MRDLITIGLPLLLMAIGAALLGFRVGAIFRWRRRALAVLGAVLLIVPVYTLWLFLTDPVSGEHAFVWWLIGLEWVGGPWCLIVGFGYFFGALQRRARG